jgi:TolB protein
MWADCREAVRTSLLKRFFIVALAVVGLAQMSFAQRRPVLPQIDLPHPYYYREMYLPQLTSGPSSVTWSPDSHEVIYSMAGSLWREKIGSGVAQQLTDGPGYDYQPDWSPDGKSALYVSYQKDSMELWLLDLGTGKAQQLTAGGAVNVEPRWSPDGKQIVFTSTLYNKRLHIFKGAVSEGKLVDVVRLTGESKSSLPRYYYSAYDMEINPVWARDGKEILFVSNRGHIHGTGGFWRMKAEPGAEAREIHYEETNWKARPDFSPDGSKMAYSSYLGRQWHQIWLMPANGGDAFPISYGDGDNTNVRWSPDGRQIAFISNRNGNTELWLEDVLNGGEKRVEIAERRYLGPTMSISLRVTDKEGRVVPARVSVTGEDGRFYAPENAWIHADDGYDRAERSFEAHYFHTQGTDTVIKPLGKFQVEVMAGFDRPLKAESIVTTSGTNRYVIVQLAPKWKIGREDESWASSDLHVHMNYGGTYRNTPKHLAEQAEAEDVAIVNDLIVNKEQRFPDIAYDGKRLDSASKANTLILHGQEFHTSYWGHRGLLNIADHILLPGYAGYPNTAAASLYPMNADVSDLAHAQDALVGAVHPFDETPDPFANPPQNITDELPVDAALGKLDYMEIVGFSDHRSTASVWYRLLNLGYRIPAGAGTDAMANYASLRGPVGMNRVYARVSKGRLEVDAWLAALKNGRTFATNGPLLDFSLGSQEIGGELTLDAGQTAVPFKATLRSIVPVDHLEIVCNGHVAQSLSMNAARDAADVSGAIPLTESGWCVLRAWSDKAEYPVLDNYVYATTSPIYVTVAGKAPRSAEDAKYFVAWIERTIHATANYPDWNSADEKAYVLRKLKEAKTIYEKLQ